MSSYTTLSFARRRKVAPMVSGAAASVPLPAPLAAAVDDALAEAFSRSFFKDPLFGEELTAIRAPLDSICRRHGILIERAIAHALAADGRFDVQTQVAVPISRAALDLCEANSESATSQVALPASGRVRTAVLDLVIYDRAEQRLVLASVKRGGGLHSGAVAREARLEQRAAAIVLRSMVTSQGLGVRSCDVMLIDWYGRSGLSDGSVVTGAQIDAYFGVPIAPIVDAMTDRLAAGVKARAELVFAQLGLVQTAAELGIEDQSRPRAAQTPVPCDSGVVIDLAHCLAGLPRRRRGRQMRAIRAND